MFLPSHGSHHVRTTSWKKWRRASFCFSNLQWDLVLSCIDTNNSMTLWHTRGQFASIQSNHLQWKLGFDMIWYDETLRAACDRTHWERRNAIGTPFCLLRRAGTYGDGGAAVASLQDTSRILAVGCFIPDCQLLVVEYHGFLRIDLPNGSLVVGEDPREAHVRSGIFAVSQRCGATGLAVCWLLMLGSDRKGESFLTRHVSFSKPALCRNDMVIPQIGQS